jgi:ribonuclease E
MSRQRIRASVLESTTQVCSHCGGTGHVRSESSIALHVLRGVEEYLLRNTTHNITVRCTPDTALYLLNHKRATIVDYEARFGVAIIIAADESVGAQHFAIDRGEAVENPVKIESLIQMLPDFEEEEDDIIIEADEDEDEEDVVVKAEKTEARQPQADTGEDGKRKRKRRRRRRGKNGGQNGAEANGNAEDDTSSDDQDDEADADSDEEASTSTLEASDGPASEDGRRKRRRRGKRGGRRNRDENGNIIEEDGQESETSEAVEDGAAAAAIEGVEEASVVEAVEAEAPTPTVEETEKPKKPRRTRKAKETLSDAPAEPMPAAAPVAVETVEPVVVNVTVADIAVEEAGEASADLGNDTAETTKPVRANRGDNVSSSEPVVTSPSSEGAEGGDQSKPRKGGWWQRRGFF